MYDHTLGGMILVSAFLLTIIFIKGWIKAASRAGLVGRDMNKFYKPPIPESGGVPVIIGFSIGLLSLVFLKTFFMHTETHLVEILAVLSTVLLAVFIGYIDDSLKWKKGLRQSHKVLLTLPIAVPLMVIQAGHSTMSIPFVGEVNFGSLYPLVIIPLGIIGASNGFNLLGGLNGLEGGMGAIILGTLGLASLLNQHYWVSFISFVMVFCLASFLFFNRFPARVFPGDSLTYPVGALVAAVAILGNMERTALILFIPYFIEFAIKAKNKFKSECFGIPQGDGTLKAPWRIGSLTHIMMKYVRTERGVVAAILCVEFLIALAAVLSLGVV